MVVKMHNSQSTSNHLLFYFNCSYTLSTKHSDR